MARTGLLLAGAMIVARHALAEDGGGSPPAGGSAERVVEREVSDPERIPLRHIDVDARVSGSLAEVTVEQVYENRVQGRVEAVYIFPLPDDAAIHEMVMVIGERRIVADLRERQAARVAYEEARDNGQAASLLEQERPNVFTMSVANIMPGEQIRVLVRYVEQVPYRDGRYRFHFPTVVGPRFIPGTPLRLSGTGVVPDTAAVPDASRITPSVLPEGARTPYEVDFDLDLEAPMPVLEVSSSSHNLAIQRITDGRLRAELVESERQPDRDIELSYALAGDAPALGMLSHFDTERGGFFTLMVEPPRQLSVEDIRPKELVFVLDSSGSMTGAPLDTSVQAVRYALDHLNPSDTFQIIQFEESASSLSPVPLANTPTNVRRANAYLDSLQGGGGTNMTEGIVAALRPPPDPQRMRIVLFLTDGFIGNDGEVIALVGREIGQSRLFSLGVGSSVNRYLLDRMATEGRGTVHYVNVGEPTTEVVEAFYGRFRNPVLTDITVDWGGLDVSDVVPGRIPDVFEGSPLMLTGRFRAGGTATIHVRGKYGQRPVEIPMLVALSPGAEPRPAVPYLWARRRIDELQVALAGDPTSLRAQILPLALQFDIMSQFTSFVAIEQRVSAGTADPLRTVGVPVALPHGVTERNIGAQVQGQSDVALGVDPENAMGVLMGNQIGDSFGYGGLGLRGTGRGGGAVGAGSIGLGNLGTVGHGAGGGADGSGYGRGGGGLRGRMAAAPQIRTGTATVRGSLSRDVIRRYIRRQLNAIRHCYETELTRRPSLSGRVSIRFVIGADGRVMTSMVESSTLGVPSVEQCVARAVQRISFPSTTGGVVLVTYPFMFQPAPEPRR